MSGTSLDGLDIACCRFSLEDEQWQWEVLEAETVSYTNEWAQRLQALPEASAHELALANADYGLWMGKQVQQFLHQCNLQPHLLSSHGHTIFHEPKRKLTLQIGDGAALAATTGLPTVCDFRPADVYRGGQGAPLVPIGDALLFSDYRALINLGGIANISYKGKAGQAAYDICACNLLLNHLARKAGEPYDAEGQLAAEGAVDDELLEQLNSWRYLRQQPPKSLDKGEVERELLPLAEQELPPKDLLATATAHVAQQLAAALRQVPEPRKVLLTGGGAHNTHLIKLLREQVPHWEVEVPQPLVVDYKEALVFAFLGLLRVLGQENILSSYTGARQNSVAGALHLP